MIIALVVVAVAALLAVGAVAVDGAGRSLAERRAASAVTTSFGHPATVRIHGTPFLTQAVRGRYADVEVRGTLRVGDIAGGSLVGRLRNVHLPLRDLLARRVRELPCEHVHGTVLLPYPELARVARIPGLTLRFDGERLLAAAALPVPDVPGLASSLVPGLGSVVPGFASAVPGLGAVVPGLTGLGGLSGLSGLGGVVPGLGQLARVNGAAVLTLRGPHEVWLQLQNVSVAGVAVPSIVLKQLVPALTVPIPFPRLPFGLGLDELRPTPDGLAVTGSAVAVLLRPGEPSRPLPDGGARQPRPTRQDERPDE